MSIWDVTTPAGNEAANQGDDRIREMKAALQDALRGDDTEGNEAIFPGSAPTTAPVFRYRGLSGATGARPAAGQYGFYFDSTRNALQRDNGSSWVDVGTVIPSGSVLPWYQPAAPVGWTKVVTQDDKVFRVVAGDGGGVGGTTPLSGGITHVVDSHSHTISDDGSHSHVLNTVGTETSVNLNLASALRAGIDAGQGNNSPLLAPVAGGGNTLSRKSATTDTAAAHNHGGTTGSETPGTDTITLAYVDLILASKD